MKTSSALYAIALGLLLSTQAVCADEKHKAFFQSIEGNWIGPGEIVAGKYKGTKFNCDLKGSTPSNKMGMTLSGLCRVGIFTKEMKAIVIHNGTNYNGIFNEGAEGDGLNITSGDISDNRIIVGLNRKDLYGAMLARVTDANNLNVTVSVRVDENLIPVIGIKLKRPPADQKEIAKN